MENHGYCYYFDFKTQCTFSRVFEAPGEILSRQNIGNFEVYSNLDQVKTFMRSQLTKRLGCSTHRDDFKSTCTPTGDGTPDGDAL